MLFRRFYPMLMIELFKYNFYLSEVPQGQFSMLQYPLVGGISGVFILIIIIIIIVVITRKTSNKRKGTLNNEYCGI